MRGGKAPHCVSLKVTILLHMFRGDMCVVYASRGRLRSKNIVNGAQVSPTGRADVRETIIGMVQIKRCMSVYLLVPLQDDYGPA